MGWNGKQSGKRRLVGAGVSDAGSFARGSLINVADSENESGDIVGALHEVREQLLAAHAELEKCARDARGAAGRAKQTERIRLGRMLHDGLQQVLVAAKMRLEVTIRLLPDGEAKKSALATQDLLIETIKVSRTLTMDLSPQNAVGDGLGPALVWLSVWFETQHGLKVTVEVAPDAEPESQAIRTLVFQGVREILFNAVKHAGIDNARVRMVRAGTDVQIVVEDSGIGFEPASLAARTEGFGLFNVKHRLEQLGGALELVSAPGAGTRVTLKAPVTHGGAGQAPGAPR